MCSFVQEPPDIGGLVHVVAAVLADPPKRLDADGEPAPRHGCTLPCHEAMSKAGVTGSCTYPNRSGQEQARRSEALPPTLPAEQKDSTVHGPISREGNSGRTSKSRLDTLLD